MSSILDRGRGLSMKVEHVSDNPGKGNQDDNDLV
jgi:hypothetical protein